jgi:hypothetical protein
MLARQHRQPKVAAVYSKQLNHNGVFGQGHLPAPGKGRGEGPTLRRGPVA